MVATELRTLRRQVRTWVFLALGIGVAGAAYGYYSYLHGVSSFAQLSMGTMLPRFTTAYFNSYLLWFFMAALVFLAFDLRHRDERERVAAVVDARPVGNVALIGGRLCAVVLVVGLPLFGVLLLIQATGTVGRALGWWVDPIEPFSMFVFLFLDALPALILWSATVLLLAAGLRNRLAVAATALALLGIHMWSFAVVPSYLMPAVSLLHIHDNWASDLAPRIPEFQTYMHRGALLMLAAAFVVWAGALYPRADGRLRHPLLLIGAVPALLGVAGIGVVVLRGFEGMDLRETWLAAHNAASREPTPLVDHISGVVTIVPGEAAHLHLELQLRGTGTRLSTLLFSFNPGFEIAELHVDDVRTPFRHEHGLLTVDPVEPLAPDQRATLSLQASGIPDPDFAYLDSVVDWRQESARNAILWSGTAGGIFETRYVALMPGLRWLPVPGANLDDAGRAYAATVDLTVEVPPGWLVAGPGRREAISPGRYRFQPAANVPKVGLFAARFARRAAEVDGVTLELLMHPGHLRNLAYFAGVEEQIRSRLAEILRDAARYGIPYPYRGFTVVEVPAHLREYGGGHWLDTRMALPGLLLLKEQGFPYANFWRLNDPAQYATFPGGLDALKVQWLEFAFSNRIGSGSALRAFGRNLVTFQTAAVGPGAPALDYVREEIGHELFRDPATFRGSWPLLYTAHRQNADAGFGATIAGMVDGLANAGGGATGFRQFFYVQPSVWERALRTSLAAVDYETEPSKAVAAFALRGRAVALSIVDGLGRERAGAFLAALRDGHDRGYDVDDFHAAETDITRLVGDWLHDVALPGFLASRAVVERVADDETGKPRYEIRVHVRNDQPVPGLVRLALGASPQSARSQPLRIDGNAAAEIATVSAEPPASLWLEPYLALNQVPFQIELPDHVDANAKARGPFVGSRPSTWSPPDTPGVVIDDLDPGFAVERRSNAVRLGDDMASGELDQGLPTWSREGGVWARANIPSSWGKYRRTAAGAIAGDGGDVAVFDTVLPTPGRWRLDYHIPNRDAMAADYSIAAFGTLGAHHMTLVRDGDRTPVVFDGAAADVGWNEVGRYALSSGAVRLEVATRSDGEMVIADAIRWVPLPPNNETPQNRAP